MHIMFLLAYSAYVDAHIKHLCRLSLRARGRSKAYLMDNETRCVGLNRSCGQKNPSSLA